MSDNQALIMHITTLRSSTEYQTAFRNIRACNDIASMASNKHNRDYQDIRFLIGIWIRISILLCELKDEERSKIFRCTPVQLMWILLEPAIVVIRNDGADASDNTPTLNYAKEFEDLSSQYSHWAKQAGFSSQSEQAICALFG